MKMEIFNLDPKSRYHIDDFNRLNCKDIFFLHTFNDDLLKCIFSPFFRWRIFQFSMAFFHYFSNTNFFFRHFSWKHISWRVISKKNQIDSIFSSRDIEIYIKKGKFLFSWNLVLTCGVVIKNFFLLSHPTCNPLYLHPPPLPLNSPGPPMV